MYGICYRFHEWGLPFLWTAAAKKESAAAEQVEIYPEKWMNADKKLDQRELIHF